MTAKKKTKDHQKTDAYKEQIREPAFDATVADEEETLPVGEVAAEDVASLKAEVEKYKKLAEENLRHFQYASADLENLKKRAIQDRNEMRKYGIIPFAKEILHVVDNLERALEHLENADKESLTKGIEMTLSEFNKVLESFNIKQIPALGKFFDPNVHEAFLKVETKNYEPNAVIDELQKGFMLEDRLLRPSKVSVSVAPKEEEKKTAVSEEASGDETAAAEDAAKDIEIEINEN